MPRNRRRWLSGALLLVALLAVPPPKRAATPPVVLRQAHFAADDMTAGAAALPLPARADAQLAGYGPLRTARGVRDAPMARALVIGPWAVVALDLLEASPALVEAIRARVALPALFVLATHTHSGPGGTDPNLLAQAFGEGPYHAETLEAFADTAARAVKLAQGAERPASLTFFQTARPELHEERDPGGIPEDGLTVLRAEALGGKPIGTLAIFGAHPTLLPRDERLLSADWPGSAARELERSGGVALVVQGAGGDVSVPRAGLPADPGARIETYGKRFAAAVSGMDMGQGLHGLDFASAQVTLPAPDLSRFLPSPLHGAADWVAELFTPATVEVAFVRLGSRYFYCVPGELTGAVAQAWDKLATPLSLCNGDISYIEAPELWQNRQGESLALFGPDLARRLSQGIRAAYDAATAIR